MKIYRYILLFSFTIGIISGCDPCEKTTKTWKHDAVVAVTELKQATKEVSDNDSIFNSIKFDNGDLYLDSRVLEEMPQENKNAIPRLRQWFQKNIDKKGSRSGISFKDGTITASFKTCIYKSISYEACLYYSENGIRPSFTKGWKQGVELKDSLDLGDNWYYILSRCDGCMN